MQKLLHVVDIPKHGLAPMMMKAQQKNASLVS